jgi:hypothetical protein
MGTVALVAAAAELSAGATFALFSARRPPQTNTFTAGTVTLTETQDAECDVGTGSGETANALFPGDGSSSYGGADPTCTLSVTYAGNLAGYVGLDVLIASKKGTLPAGAPAGTVAKPLYDGTPSGMQIKITDTVNGSSNFYVNGTNFTPQGSLPPPGTAIPSVTCPAAFTGYDECFQAADLLVSTTAFVNGGTNTFSVNYEVPTTSTSGYQNGTAVVVLTAHAVQASNNALPANCHALVQCVTNFNWG